MILFFYFFAGSLCVAILEQLLDRPHLDLFVFSPNVNKGLSLGYLATAAATTTLL